MNGVSMPESCVVESCSIVVNSHRTICNLIKSISIDICNTQIVVSLSRITSPLRLIGVESPFVSEVLSIPIPCRNNRTRVVSPTENSTCMHAIEISHSSEVSFRAVGMVVAPCPHLPSFRDVVHRCHSLSRESVEDCQVFRTFHDTSEFVVAETFPIEEAPARIVSVAS